MKYLLFVACFLTLVYSLSQTQKGQDLDGEAAGDEFGYVTYMPNNNTLAVGAPFNNGNGSDAGHVRVYEWNGSMWIQKGIDIDGATAGDQFGFAISMPNANTIAIGSPNSNIIGPAQGRVRIYTWNGTAWVVKGSGINGEASYDKFGSSISMYDSNTVAIGAPGNSGSGLYAGHVRIYTWNGTTWVKKGLDIDGENADDRSGTSICLIDSNLVSIGAPQNDGVGNNAGHVRVYKWNGSSWIQKGLDIDGVSAGDLSGTTISMPDTNTLAISSPENSGIATNSGQVRVFEWNGSAWVQKGNDLNGLDATDRFGLSVSMPTNNLLAIGANNNVSGNGSGEVKLFEWSGVSWIQKGLSIIGDFNNDKCGFSLCMPDSVTIAVGLPLHDNNGIDDGKVRVYSVSPTTSLRESNKEEAFTLYPNPFEHNFTIQFNNPKQNSFIEIRDASGRLLLKTSNKNKSIVNVELNEIKGIYFITITTDLINYTYKMIKQ